MQIYEYGDLLANTILIQPVDDHDLSIIENEVAMIAKESKKDFKLIAVKVENWNKDLSPWAAQPVFGKDNFGGGAEYMLEKILALCSDKSKTYYIGGYSLAGLFALWTAYNTDIFSGVAAASPSVWFPEFIEYMKKNDIKAERVYLSLGNKEWKTRNPVMATVGEKLKEAYDLLESSGVKSVLEWNEGNHFQDADLRTAKAFAWLLK